MPPSNQQQPAAIAARLQAANAVIDEAEKLALQFFQQRHQFALEEKNANEFVSQADRDVEKLIRTRLAKLLPSDHVTGEELGGAYSPAFWSIDPIDGTANFMRGSPLWGVSLGFVENGQPSVGVITFPSLGFRLSAGSGLGVWHNNMRFTRKVAFPAVKVAAIGDSTHWPTPNLTKVETVLRKAGWGVAQYRCATIGLGFAALGYTDGYIEKNNSIWDIAAGSVICAEAGLKIHSSGCFTSAGQSIIAATDELHQIVRRYF